MCRITIVQRYRIHSCYWRSTKHIYLLNPLNCMKRSKQSIRRRTRQWRKMLHDSWIGTGLIGAKNIEVVDDFMSSSMADVYGPTQSPSVGIWTRTGPHGTTRWSRVDRLIDCRLYLLIGSGSRFRFGFSSFCTSRLIHL